MANGKVCRPRGCSSTTTSMRRAVRRTALVYVRTELGAAPIPGGRCSVRWRLHLHHVKQTQSISHGITKATSTTKIHVRMRNLLHYRKTIQNVPGTTLPDGRFVRRQPRTNKCWLQQKTVRMDGFLFCIKNVFRGTDITNTNYKIYQCPNAGNKQPENRTR